MPDPKDADDPWADLYRDLEVDAAAAKPAERVVEADEPDAVEFTELVEADAEGEYEPEVAGVGEPVACAENGPAGDEGPKKRRRRRRRRKKKGGQPGEGETVAAPAEAENVSEAFADNDTAEDDSQAGYEPESVEDGSPETAREVIANWNVPSWPEIVAGLYRPDRG